MSDINLIHEFNQGKERAFRVIFDRFYSEFLLHAKRMIQNTADAEDITLRVFRGLFQGCQNFNSTDEIKKYLYVSIRNKCMSEIKTKRIRERVYKEASVFISDIQEFDEYEIVNELTDRLINAIEQLPNDMKKTFKLLYYEQMKPNDVAKHLNIAITTVYTQRDRAIKALKLSLSN